MRVWVWEKQYVREIERVWMCERERWRERDRVSVNVFMSSLMWEWRQSSLLAWHSDVTTRSWDNQKGCWGMNTPNQFCGSCFERKKRSENIIYNFVHFSVEIELYTFCVKWVIYFNIVVVDTLELGWGNEQQGQILLKRK